MISKYIQSYTYVLAVLIGVFLYTGTAHAATCAPQSLSQVWFGQSGSAVSNVQQCLIDAGFSIPAGATGYFGAQTQSAVKELYRTRLNMPEWDGRSVGPQGRAQLAVARRTQLPSQKPAGEAKAKEYAYKKVASSDELRTYIEATDGFGVGLMLNARSVGMPATAEATMFNSPLSAPDADESGKSTSDRFSSTNVQVGGIDEPDIVKTDGNSIFISPRSEIVFREATTIAIDDSVSTSELMPGRYIAPSTKVVDAFPLSELKLVSKDAIPENGEMLLMDGTLIIFTYEGIVAYDVKDPAKPKKVWDRKYGEDVQLVTARANDGTVYLITSTYLRRDRPCPVVPLMNAGLVLPCTRVWVPEHLESLDTSYSILALDPTDGKVAKEITFAGKANNTVVAMFADNVYVTHRESSGRGEVYLEFFATELYDLLSETTRARIATIRGYDISDESKMQEIATLIETETSGKGENEALRIMTEIQNRAEQYLTKHMRDIDRTIVSRVALDTLTLRDTKSIPGHLLNQFSIDEYNGYLRLAVTIGDRWGGGTQVNDVYVLNSGLEIVGKVLDLGFTEQVYSARFMGDRGYVVTFRQTDPFYVFDLSVPTAPKMTGELKIPGYSSYLEVLDQDTVLGVGRDGGNVKLSLFDVHDPAKPIERAVYTLTESWSEVENNHHAFLKDSEYKVVFIPASEGGYVISYEDNKLTLKAAVRGYDVRRAVFIDEYLYVVGDSKITVLDENTWKEAKTLSL